jgi:hypothetical protein
MLSLPKIVSSQSEYHSSLKSNGRREVDVYVSGYFRALALCLQECDDVAMMMSRVNVTGVNSAEPGLWHRIDRLKHVSEGP